MLVHWRLKCYHLNGVTSFSSSYPQWVHSTCVLLKWVQYSLVLHFHEVGVLRRDRFLKEGSEHNSWAKIYLEWICRRDLRERSCSCSIQVLHDLRLALDLLLSLGWALVPGPWVADLTMRSMISSAASSPAIWVSSTGGVHACIVRPEWIKWQQIYAWAKKIDLNDPVRNLQ